MSNKLQITTIDASAKQIQEPQTGVDTYGADVSLTDATGDEVAFDIQYITNKASSGADTGLVVNQTDTASPGTSLLADFQVGGSSKYRLFANGNLNVDAGSVTANSGFKSNNSYSSSSLSTMLIQVQSFTAADNAIEMAYGTHSQSSGQFNAVVVRPTYNQSSTAAATDLLINRTETAVGSGAQLLADFQVGGTSLANIDNAGALNLDPAGNSGITTGVAFGTSGTRIAEASDQSLTFYILGTARLEITSQHAREPIVSGSTWKFEVGTATNPIFCPGASDYDTGLGTAAADQLSLIAGGVEGIRITEANSSVQINAAGGTNADTSGTVIPFAIQPTYNQASGTAANTDLLINRTETNVGSGAQLLADFQVGGTSLINIDNAGQLTLDPAGNFGSTTGIAFGDGDTVIFEVLDDSLDFMFAGTARWRIGASSFGSSTTGGFYGGRSAASATSPAIAFKNDVDTGLGKAADDQLSLIAGGVEGIRLTEAVGVLQTHQANLGLTADSGSAQGGTPLTSTINVVGTVATIADSVTLPAAVASGGQIVTIINIAANSLDVFPASSDNLGAGADTAAALAGGANITYISVDATDWITKV